MLPAALLGLGAWGALLDPRGGFWLFFPVAEPARRPSRGARGTDPVGQEKAGASAASVAAAVAGRP
ncbi:hypothetical protein [Agilicoccus flavus]|uniref:hypothetical protein n=1 Tax=Agilicoccus flavus TaxID=2775968 RepID=UPI001CF65FC7|nr:hypothetical protein [Agilicoccus flavus]